MKLAKQQRALALLNAGKYRVSRSGVVFSLVNSHGNPRKTPYTLKPAQLPKGYLFVSLCVKGRAFSCLVHQLVHLQHRGSFDPVLQINHLNADKSDNRLANLELVTCAQNNAHASKLGLFPKGEKHYQGKLTKADVRFVRTEAAKGAVQAELARKLGVSTGTIRDVVHYKTWKEA